MATSDHTSPASTPSDDPRKHPMYIDTVRARHAADQAEREMWQAIERAVDPRPKRTAVDALVNALRNSKGGAS